MVCHILNVFVGRKEAYVTLPFEEAAGNPEGQLGKTSRSANNPLAVNAPDCFAALAMIKTLCTQ
jgi:hypothetical protein